MTSQTGQQIIKIHILYNKKRQTERGDLLTWNKKHFSLFLKGFQLIEYA